MADVVDGNDIGMVQAAGGLGFALEPLDDLVMAGRITAYGDGLQRNGAADHMVLGLVDHAHGATAKLGENLVAPVEDGLQLRFGSRWVRGRSSAILGGARYLQRTHFCPFYECLDLPALQSGVM